MRGELFSLRFERDRGQIMVDIGGNYSEWFKLEYALEFSDPSINQEDLGEPPSPGKLANLLQKRWGEMEILFTVKDKVRELKAFSEMKFTSLLNEPH